MKNKGAIIVLVVLVIGIIVILIIQQRERTLAMRAQQQQANQEAAIALSYLNYANNAQVIEAQESAGVADWLNAISSIGGAVSSIFGGGMFSGGGRSGNATNTAQGALNA